MVQAVDTGGDRPVPPGPSTSPPGKKQPSPSAFALKKQQSSAALTPDREGSTPKRNELLDPRHKKFLKMPMKDRDPRVVDELVTITHQLVPEFCKQLSKEQHRDLARGWTFQHLKAGEQLCRAQEECASFFVLLAGYLTVEEKKISHVEDKNNHEKRVTMVGPDCTLGHYPLVLDTLHYGFSASAAEGEGCSLLAIPKSDYVQHLRRDAEKSMSDTVALLKSTAFFAEWAVSSICRLYFWFERRKFQPNEDVVRQGDAADFCFIIRSGLCDVLVESPADAIATAAKLAVGKAEESGDEAAEPPEGAEASSPSFNSGASVSFNSGASPSFNAESSPTAGTTPTGTPKPKRVSKLKSWTKVKEAVGARHIVTLRPGAIVGEIALFSDGATRNATVRTLEHAEVLLLDKKSFLDLDQSTLQIIKENAQYNSACTKQPSDRSKADIDILQQRTAHLTHLARMQPEVHRELCRVMKYRKVLEDTVLCKRGADATCFYVIINGSVQVSNAAELPGKKKTTKKAPTTTMLQVGDAIGEADMLLDEPVYQATITTAQTCELMEVSRADFDRVLKSDRTSERGKLVSFLQSVSCLQGLTTSQLTALSKLFVVCKFTRGQLCLAHPPDVALGPCSYSADYVYLIKSGEARLLAALTTCSAIDPRAAALPDTSEAATDERLSGPLADGKAPPNRVIEAALGGHLAPIATLGPNECLSDNLLAPNADARWCLQPITSLELLIVPRKDFFDMGISSAALKDLVALRADFFRARLSDAHREAGLLRKIGHVPRAISGARTDRNDEDILFEDDDLPSSGSSPVGKRSGGDVTARPRTPRASSLTGASPAHGDFSAAREVGTPPPTALGKAPNSPSFLASSASAPSLPAAAPPSAPVTPAEDKVRQGFKARGLEHILRSTWVPRETRSPRSLPSSAHRSTPPSARATSGGKGSRGNRSLISPTYGSTVTDAGLYMQMPKMLPPLWADGATDAPNAAGAGGPGGAFKPGSVLGPGRAGRLGPARLSSQRRP